LTLARGKGGAREVSLDTERIVPDVMQVIPRTYDLILWLVLRLKEFPRDQRFLLGDRIRTLALDGLPICGAAI